MKRRARMCSGCPFNPARTTAPIPKNVLDEVDRRIAGGETWICHQTCEGAIATDRSSLCAGAPAVVA